MAKQKLTIEVGATNNVGGVFATISRDVDRLKKSIGGDSAAGQGLALLRGGGIAAGILGAVRVVGDLTEGFVNARKEGVGMVKAISDALKSNPLFGTFINAGASINELFSGDQAAAARTMAAASAQDAKTGSMAARLAALQGSGSIESLLPSGITEDQMRRRVAEASGVLGRGRTAVPSPITQNVVGPDGATGGFIVVNQQEIDAAKQYNAEFEKTLELTRDYEKRLEAIYQLRFKATPSPFMGLSDPLLKNILDTEKSQPTNLPNSPFVGAPGADPLLAAILSNAGPLASARGSAAGSLLAGLQGRLSAARGARGTLAGILGAGVSTDTRIGLSGVQSAGLAGLGGPNAEERRLERAIVELNKITEKQTDDTVKAIEDAKRDLIRELQKSDPGAGDLFGGQR
jgi:hypothetical protein